MANLRSLGMLALVLLSACGRPEPSARWLSAAPPPDRPELLAVTDRLDAMLAAREVARLERLNSPADAALRQRSAVLDGGPLPPISSRPATGAFQPRWRQAEAYMYLAAQPPRGPGPFRLPTVQAAEVVVRLASVADRPLKVTGRCDTSVRVWDGQGSRPGAAAGRPFRLTLPPGPPDGTRLVLGPDVDRCTLEVAVEGMARTHTRVLQRDSLAAPGIAALDSQLDVCPVPPADRLDPLERVVLADRWLSQGCTLPTGPIRFLIGPKDAFNAKVVALTGAPLPPEALTAGDPEMPLDFSLAPALDLVFLSSLQFRADFSGRLLVRMLEHHAARGTEVRILVSANLATGPDRRMLARMAAAHPTVQVQFYRWQPPGGTGPGSVVDQVQRGQHAKAFATLSPDPGQSRLIVGGRNLHDGFLFDSPRDLSAHPDLHDYDRTLRAPLAYFAAYDDLEVELRGPAIVRGALAQLGGLWHRDAVSGVVRPATVAAEVPGAARAGARHFLSVPHADGRALERWMVELFDAAEARIDIVSPYLNLTPALSAAMDRALSRNVRVRLILPELPPEDPLSGFKQAVANRDLARFANRMEVWRHSRSNRLLHSKLLVVDDRVGVVMAANLNARSLIHDTENGLVLLDPGPVAELGAIIEGYRAEATPLRRIPAPGPLDRLLLRLPGPTSWF